LPAASERLALLALCVAVFCCPAEANRQVRADIAASFQRVAVQHLEERCRRAVQWAQESHPEVDGLAGWVRGRADGWAPTQLWCL
jgi:hypothetical protein